MTSSAASTPSASSGGHTDFSASDALSRQFTPRQSSLFDEVLRDVVDQQRHEIVLYDGVCLVCDATVNFVTDHDPEGLVHFAPLQSGQQAATPASERGGAARMRRRPDRTRPWGLTLPVALAISFCLRIPPVQTSVPTACKCTAFRPWTP